MKDVNIFEYLEPVEDGAGVVLGYRVIKPYEYFSKRYQKRVLADEGDIFDGATGAIDINSFGWVIHDVLCRDGKFKDGTICTNWQASSVLSDILKEEGRWFRARSWFITTWLLGGGKARDNGLF